MEDDTRVMTEFIVIKKDVFFKKLYKEYHKDNNNGFCKGKNKFYLTLKTNYGTPLITIITNKSKSYFKINIKLLFQHFYPKEKYKNYHNLPK